MRKLADRPKQVLITLLIISVLLRVGSALALGNEIVELPGIFDQVSYHNLALRILDGHGFSFGQAWWPATKADAPTAHWSYLYTIYLTAVYFLFGPNPVAARLIQAVAVGILMPWLVYRLSCRIFGVAPVPEVASPAIARGQTIGLVAAAIVAIYVYFFYYAAALITESFYIVAILWSFDLAVQITRTKETRLRQWLLLGLAMGMAVLLRQLFLLFVPFMLLWLWWAVRPRLYRLALPLIVIVLLMLPWTMRNYLAFDRFVLLNTNAGYAFFWGNHPIHGTRFIPILPSSTYQRMIPRDLLDAGLDEAALDTALLGRAIDIILEDPVRYVVLSLSRFPAYFVFWPSPASSTISNISRVGSFGLFLPFMLYGIIRSFRYRRNSFASWLKSPFALLYLFIVVYTGIHLLTWTLIRYRLPLDAVFIMFAGLAVVELIEQIEARRSPGAKLTGSTS